MNIAILQARMSSSRLPGKVLKPLAGLPMVIQQINRVLCCKHIDKLVVATSTNSEDNAIANACKQHNIECFRGSLTDVLSRYSTLAKQHNATHIIRLTADCPLTDPSVIDLAIETHIKGEFDYTSNCYPRSYPKGLDVEVVTFKTLMLIDELSKLDTEREHVTLYIGNNIAEFSVGNIEQEQDLSTLRWTVDYPADFDFIAKVYENLFLAKPFFTMQDIMSLLAKQPKLTVINSQHIGD